MAKTKLIAPVIFGLGDGMTSLLGVVLYLSHTPELVLPAAASGGISSAVSMAGFKWLSDSEEGLLTSCWLGAATGIGAVCPAIPYEFISGPAALMCSMFICAIIGAAIAIMHRGRSRWLSLVQTFSVLILAFAVVITCSLVLPGGGG